ncbi:MAG TPA: CDGSH iron-sulfur domain-containing protein [Candidatus Cloacimonadota bacterium]|nr:CDGSH iron-sulfur domain-containing protein [Candidatus Cloacimonadota bacterium]
MKYQANIKEHKGKTYKVQVTKSGPYMIHGNLPLEKNIVISSRLSVAEEWKTGTRYETPEVYAICRCGHTKTPPFCDGAHEKIGFKGEETVINKKFFDDPSITTGPELTLIDALDLCIGARFCHKGGGVWKLTRESDDPAKKELAIKEACYCPSGRLVQYDNKTSEPIEPDFEPSLGIMIDPATDTSGPLWVKGYVPIISAEGTIYERRNRVTLCRCGRSSMKPFCDGKHLTIHFSDIKEKDPGESESHG